jgi:hypothetical protein
MGFSDDNQFINVQNIGALPAHYKLTFGNLQP